MALNSKLKCEIRGNIATTFFVKVEVIIYIH